MEEKDIQDELASIRSMMERSSKFISISGLSGILSGVYALVGAAIAWYVMKYSSLAVKTNSIFESLGNVFTIFYIVAGIGIAVFVASIITSVILSYLKAKRKGQSIWGRTSRALLLQVLVPVVTCGLLIILFLYQGEMGFIVPAMLIFYGLALFSAANFTFAEIKYLGLLEVVLGLIAACLPDYGLLFWAIGFGALHIIYGSMMYLKYDR